MAMLTAAQFNALISKKRQTLLRQQAAVDATTAELELLTSNMKQLNENQLDAFNESPPTKGNKK